MDKNEEEWTINDTIPLMAALATVVKVCYFSLYIFYYLTCYYFQINQVLAWETECQSLYQKVNGRIAPFCPSVKEDPETDA